MTFPSMNTARKKMDTDLEMLQKLRANKHDKAALLAVFDRYATEIYALALMKISERMPALVAEEAAHIILIGVFLHLHVNRDSIEPPTSLYDYLMASADQAIDQYVEAQEARISAV